MITNREEVIDRAFGVFVKMNYEKASITTLAKACGLTKTGITYYFPHKQDLFIATADKFLFYMQSPTNKFKVDTETLEEFIEEYIKGITSAMGRIVRLIDDGNNPFDCSLNFYYFHFLSQVRMYYPNIRQKIVTKKITTNGELSLKKPRKMEKSEKRLTLTKQQSYSGMYLWACHTNMLF